MAKKKKKSAEDFQYVLYPLDKIKIPQSFANSTPKPHKYGICAEHFSKTGKQDRPLVINHNGVLIDGYIQYLVLKEASKHYGVAALSNTLSPFLHRRECSFPEFNKLE